MEMSLIHAGLAAGAALAVLPVILHLFMRQTPKHVVFPALRLLRERQKRSRKRLRVKNWLLLLARMALLALMALALARPRLYSQVPIGDESVPTALGLVFDTSLSMKYKDKDKTRLDEAKDRAREIIEKIPESSLVYVIDSSEPGGTGLSPSAALKRIDGLTTHAVSRPLNVAMGEAYEAVAECDRPVRVVYVLTDLARTAWNPDRPAEGLDKVSKIKAGPGAKLTTFVLRLTPQDVHNVSIDAAEPSESVAIQGEAVEIHTRIRGQGSSAATRTIEFYLDGMKRDEKTVEVPPNSAQVELTFAAPTHLKEGELHRGEIVATGTPDPFEDDDKRYFTFKVRPPLKALVIADRALDAEFVATAIEPNPGPARVGSARVDRIRSAEFASRDKQSLDSYSCIFLLNVARLRDDDWGALNGYVRKGGGLVVGLGQACDSANYNDTIAGQLLPAQLDRRKEPRPETTFGKVADLTHPLFQRYGKDLDSQLAQVPVYRYWTIKQPAQPIEGARTLLSFADGAPALLERAFRGPRTGRVLLWTTPLARRIERDDPDAWNEFPQLWPFLALMDRTVPYLAGTSAEQLNFEAGENVLLKLEPNTRYTSFSVVGPDQKTTEGLPPPTHEFLEVMAPQLPGQWTVKAMTADNRAAELGFSLNPPHAESQFTPLDQSDLDTIFGKDGYVLAEDAQSFKQKEGIIRRGYEAFPWMMFLILIVVTLECLLANTFYKEAPQARPAGAVA
jgi:hypothetical protein